MEKVKYPRTLHLPFSKSITSNDKVLHNYLDYFKGKKVVITEKMDGENMTIYNDYFHSRSITANKKEYQTYMYSLIVHIQQELSDNIRLCAEYMYATHSIKYDNLQGYLYLLSVWDNNKCLSWDKVKEYSDKYNLPIPLELYTGIFSEKELLKSIKIAENNGSEGVVMRVYDSFDYDNFSTNVVKYVRENHIQTDSSWGKDIQINNILGK